MPSWTHQYFAPICVSFLFFYTSDILDWIYYNNRERYLNLGAEWDITSNFIKLRFAQCLKYLRNCWYFYRNIRKIKDRYGGEGGVKCKLHPISTRYRKINDYQWYFLIHLHKFWQNSLYCRFRTFEKKKLRIFSLISTKFEWVDIPPNCKFSKFMSKVYSSIMSIYHYFHKFTYWYFHMYWYFKHWVCPSLATN